MCSSCLLAAKVRTSVFQTSARLKEPAPEHFREVAISRDARSHYYTSFGYREREEECIKGSVTAFDLGIKTLATGVNEQGSVYHVGGFMGSRWYDRQLDKIRSKRDICKKKSRRYIHLSLVYKCLLYGKELVFLDESNTSKMCSGCGHLQAMPLYKRTYTCTGCGLVLDRDENSAINILARYFARLGPHTGYPVRCADVFTATAYV